MAVQAVLALSGLIAAVFAALMVFQRSLYASAICLLAVLLQISVFFFFTGAPLLAFLQTMIYAGAVMVLVVITIMAAPVKTEGRWSSSPVLPRWLAVLAVLLPLAEVLFMVWRAPIAPVPAAGGFALQPSIASVLFGPYAVATEAVTLLMFVAGLAVAK